MQTPLTTRKVYGAWIIEDATGARIAVLAVAGPDDKDTEQDARQFVRAVNAYDAILAACEAALEYLTDKAADQDLSPDGIEAELALLLVGIETANARGTK